MYFEPNNEFEEKLGAYFQEKIYPITISKNKIVDLYIDDFLGHGSFHILEIDLPEIAAFNKMLFPNYVLVKEVDRQNKGDNYKNTEFVNRIDIELLFDLDIIFGERGAWSQRSRSELTEDDIKIFHKALVNSFVILYHNRSRETLFKNLYKITWVD